VAGAVVDKVFVNFVGDEEEVVLEDGFGDGLKLGESEDFATGVGWGVEDDGAGLGVMAAQRTDVSRVQSGSARGTRTGLMRRERSVETW
jgi:hypothetical protein